MIARLALVLVMVPAIAHAERPAGVCVDVGVDFTPTDALQIVAWIEKPDGTFVDTIYVTNKVGRYGLGNRPGRPDFNTGGPTHDSWPYGRRTQTFPVWAHRHGKTFPLVVFQSSDESNMSRPYLESSLEPFPPYCRPTQVTEPMFDGGTCASPSKPIYTDKGRFSPDEVSLYPPRIDIKRDVSRDAPAVDLFGTYNPFDAISHPTPLGGEAQSLAWVAPQSVDYGDYVLFVEAAKTYDFNTTYNATTYPSPTVSTYNSFGQPWRGQPSVVYRVPFTIAPTDTVASSDAYVGYGDAEGESGALHPPDATITIDTPGSGASRLQLVSDASSLFRLRVRSHEESDTVGPAALGAPAVTNVGSTTATIQLTASGDDGMTGRLAGYEIRVRANSPMTTANFVSSTAATAIATPVAPGETQTIELTGLYPETEYWVGIRPIDNCFNKGELAVVSLTTLDRVATDVPWCFVATAAYGSAMANDVELLRHFRDSMLQRTVLGELVVETYYTFGPALAGMIGESELLRAGARAVLGPVVAWVRRLAD